ncbi:MAG: hypothetical protein K8S24_00490 [Candidatus Aegiribacteria sp.]|nr:hypothetical protein [Candidatus Aegiribacteria sp.]
MTVTARRYALLNRISPKFRQLAGLYILELAVIFSWTFLLDTVFNFISGSWFILLPVSYLLAVSMLAWLERARTGSGGQCPLEAFGLAEIALNGFRPSEWQTLIRLLLTPPFLLLLCIGLVQLPRTGKTILQMISGTRIVPLDTNMDPRPDEEIYRNRKKALMKVISYTMISLMVATIIILVPPELSGFRTGERIPSIHSLPSAERELLASYLEMKAMYPDSLEFHVRLASLFYRNNMEEDLMLELVQIRRLDPNHSILILEEDFSVTMEDLMIEQDSIFYDSIQVTVTEETAPPADEDTVTQDPAVQEPDSVSPRIVSSDSIDAPMDSVSTIGPIETHDLIEEDSLILPSTEDTIPKTETPIIPQDENIPEETPDIIATEDTTTVVSVDSTETSGDMESTEPPGDVESTESTGDVESTESTGDTESTEPPGDVESTEPPETTEEPPPPDPQPEPEGT